MSASLLGWPRIRGSYAMELRQNASNRGHPVLSKSQSMLRNVDTAKMHYARRTLLKPLPKGTAPCL